MYTVSISVKPFVKKYIIARYNTPVWDLNKSERIGKILYAHLERAPFRYQKSKLDLGDSLIIKICPEYANNKGVYLSNDSIEDFNEQIKLELIEEIAMYTWKLKHRVGLKKYKELYVKQSSTSKTIIRRITDPDIFQYFEVKEIIYDILGRYKITEDDFPFDTVQKCCQRLKLPLLTA